MALLPILTRPAEKSLSTPTDIYRETIQDVAADIKIAGFGAELQTKNEQYYSAQYRNLGLICQTRKLQACDYPSAKCFLYNSRRQVRASEHKLSYLLISSLPLS